MEKSIIQFWKCSESRVGLNIKQNGKHMNRSFFLTLYDGVSQKVDSYMINPTFMLS